MELRSTADAVRRALEWAGIPAAGAETAYRVRRLDVPGSTYYLVLVGDQAVCLDERTGGALTSARVTRSPVRVDSATALSRAALGPSARTELVWKPCAATMSMFDPLWEIATAERRAWVDQHGGVWATLPPKRPGGGPG